VNPNAAAGAGHLLFRCSACGHIIAGTAPRCIGCGTPGPLARHPNTWRTAEPSDAIAAMLSADGPPQSETLNNSCSAVTDNASGRDTNPDRQQDLTLSTQPRLIKVLLWTSGLLLILAAWGTLIDKQVVPAFFFLLAGLALFPPSFDFLTRQSTLRVGTGVRTAIVVVALIFAGTTASQKSREPESLKIRGEPSETTGSSNSESASDFDKTRAQLDRIQRLNADIKVRGDAPNASEQQELEYRSAEVLAMCDLVDTLPAGISAPALNEEYISVRSMLQQKSCPKQRAAVAEIIVLGHLDPDHVRSLADRLEKE
jgi:hypothetical protein